METRSCVECGNPLPKYRRKYCSDDCGQHCFEKTYWQWWENARKMALRRANNHCEEPGCHEYAAEVHHIEKLDGERWCNTGNRLDNLICLCRQHHKDRHKLERETAEWQTEIPNRKEIQLRQMVLMVEAE